MLPPTPHNFILFELDFDVKFPLLCLLLFLNDLKIKYYFNILIFVLGSLTYGASNISFVEDKRYSDYVVRELKLVVDGNKTRNIMHYHYLQWKVSY